MQELINTLLMKTLNKLILLTENVTSSLYHLNHFIKLLPGNYKLLKHRLFISKPKLDKNEELKQECDQVFDNYLKGGIIEKVDDDDYEVLQKYMTCHLGQL